MGFELSLFGGGFHYAIIQKQAVNEVMKKSFGGICQGSLDLLSGRELYILAKNLRYGCPADSSADETESDEEDEDGEDWEY